MTRRDLRRIFARLVRRILVPLIHKQTAKVAYFRNCTAEHPQGELQEVPKGGLLSLELQFGHDELMSYTEYRKTELTRKSADWINRASNAFWLSTSGTISAKTIGDLRVKTLAKYECESSKSKVLTFAVAFLK